MNVRQLLENGMLVGVGALSLTREKAKAIVDGLVDRGEVRRDETTTFVDRLTARGEEEREALRNMIEEEIDRGLGRLNLATTEDVENLHNKIDALSRHLEK